jgi:FHS family glucose/mannose:H+ symporter-like MFS transporter
MTTSSPPSEPPARTFVFIMLFIGFILTGIAATMLGPILPVFIARWKLSDSQAGFFFTTQFAGSLIGVGLSSVLQATRGYRQALMLGFLLMAAGVAGLTANSHYAALLATAACGCGFGVAIPATNLCVAEISGARRSSSLTLVNMAWGAGAIVCPILVLTGLKASRLPEILFAIAACTFFLTIGFWFMKLDTQAPKAPNAHSVLENSYTHPIHIPIALGLLFYLYVGTENGISGWAAEQSRRIGGGTASTIVPMFFWAGLLSGRGISAALLLRIKENLLVIFGLLLSAVGTTVLLSATSHPQIILGAVLAGFGLAGLYPVFIAWLSKWYGTRARRLGGAMFALASLGGATVPWIVGFVSQQSHSLRTGLLVPLAGCLAMIALVVALRRHIAR